MNVPLLLHVELMKCARTPSDSIDARAKSDLLAYHPSAHVCFYDIIFIQIIFKHFINIIFSANNSPNNNTTCSDDTDCGANSTCTHNARGTNYCVCASGLVGIPPLCLGIYFLSPSPCVSSSFYCNLILI